MSPFTISVRPDGKLVLRVPSNHNNKLGHDVVIPATTDGLAFLVRTLQQAQGNPTNKIGQPGFPDQHMVDEWLRHNSPSKKIEGIQLPSIDFSDLEITYD